MSIGKRLLELRQRRGLSQEELASQLHVSRQTISKWESDLSLPDMKMMLEIAAFYQIAITDLLGIDEQPQATHSIEHIYEQTNFVLENIQIETKKRQKRDLIVICGICVTCLILMIMSILLFLRISELRNTTTIQHEYVSSGENKESFIHSFEMNEDKMIYDLTKQTIDVRFLCKLNEFVDDTKVKLVFTDTDNKTYQYDMLKKEENGFVYEGTIPFVDYKNIELLIQQKGATKTQKVEESILSFSETVYELIHLQIPEDKDFHLYKDRIIFFSDYSRLGTELQKRMKGQIQGKATLDISKEFVTSGPYSHEAILLFHGDVPLDKKQTLYLKSDLSINDKVNSRVSITINGKEFIFEDIIKIVENSVRGVPFELIRER